MEVSVEIFNVCSRRNYFKGRDYLYAHDCFPSWKWPVCLYRLWLQQFFLKSMYVCIYIYISQRCQSFRDFKTENKLQIIIEENFGDYWSQSLVQPLTTLHQLELISKDERKWNHFIHQENFNLLISSIYSFRTFWPQVIIMSVCSHANIPFDLLVLKHG